ncbi:hypothetical protein L596_024093 [Steinernema carpocapsae]|uniref:Large ribosomal subunit protein uL3m n=1 Tax=Steinernema carpocapsae TaxID=34508 RepID=A0A4U5MFP2_STECR|nr:hypothetical protein L596_024093 [Steinernema carpocapsae]
MRATPCLSLLQSCHGKPIMVIRVIFVGFVDKFEDQAERRDEGALHAPRDYRKPSCLLRGPRNLVSHIHRRKAQGVPYEWAYVTVGAVNANPKLLTANYRNMFERQNIPAKQKLGSFLVTEDAVVAPGTKLDVRHFLPGQFVTVSGKTIDWGFQGGMHRWGMRGMPTRGLYGLLGSSSCRLKFSSTRFSPRISTSRFDHQN